MEKVSIDVVLKTADLAKINVDSEAVLKYQKQFSDILMHIDQIKDVNTKDVKPLITPYFSVNDYNDEKIELIDKKSVLKHAFRKDENYIIVPKVIKW